MSTLMIPGSHLLRPHCCEASAEFTIVETPLPSCSKTEGIQRLVAGAPFQFTQVCVASRSSGRNEILATLGSRANWRTVKVANEPTKHQAQLYTARDWFLPPPTKAPLLGASASTHPSKPRTSSTQTRLGGLLWQVHHKHRKHQPSMTNIHQDRPQPSHNTHAQPQIPTQQQRRKAHFVRIQAAFCCMLLLLCVVAINSENSPIDANFQRHPESNSRSEAKVANSGAQSATVPAR